MTQQAVCSPVVTVINKRSLGYSLPAIYGSILLLPLANRLITTATKVETQVSTIYIQFGLW